jgi:transposase InsO family protein
MMQFARNLIDPLEGFLRGTRLLIHHRSSLFSDQFRQLLRSAKEEGLRLLARSPNLNAFAERFVRTLRQECLARMIFFGEASLRQAVEEFVTHCKHERNDQALDNKIIQSDVLQFPMEGEVRCRKRHGGLLRCYYRETA